MKSDNFKVYVVDDKKMIFSTEKFKNAIYLYKSRNNMRICEIEENIAERVSVTPAAVHNWKSGNNGPGDMEIIKGISEYLGVDYKMILTDSEKSNTEKYKLNDFQIRSSKRIYDAVIIFLHHYEITDDFRNVYADLKREYCSEKAKKMIWKHILECLNKIEIVILQEYFYLHDCEIYQEFLDYYYEYLDEPHLMYKECVEDEYEYDELMSNNLDSIEYGQAIDKINEIIDRMIV